MMIVAVVNQKGGVGKTTVTMGLASVAAKHSRVLVVDVDPQQSATDWAELAGEELPFDFDDSTDPSLLSRLREADYDLIFVDTPGSIDNTSVLGAVLDASDFVILPLQSEPMSVKPLMRTIRSLVEPRELPYRALLNLYDPRDGKAAREDAEAALDAMDVPRFQTAIRRYGIHTAAPGNGEVITTYKPHRRSEINAVADFTDVALELNAIRANGRA